MANRSPLKFLPDGTPNPKWKPRKSGPSGKSGKSGKKLTKFNRGHFVCYDSEGVNTGRMIDENTEEHISILWANSEGNSIHKQSGLSSVQILQWLCDCFRRYKNAIHIAFGASYDMQQALRDIPKDCAQNIWENQGYKYTEYEGFLVRMMPRKFLSVVQMDPFGRKLAEGVLYDAIGFFQANFINTCERWLGKTYEHLSLIEAGKKLRHEFGKVDIDFIKRYNAAELEALKLVMQKLRDSLKEMNLPITKWYGAGAVCSAMYQKHEVKQHIGELPPEVFQISRYAYFGGRIEMIRQGYFEGDIHDYDINSAYPAAQVQLPELASGHWIKANGKRECRAFLADDDNWFSVFMIRWNFDAMNSSEIIHIPFFPFPFRSAKWCAGMILFPSTGLGCYWAPEVRAAFHWLEGMRRKYGDAVNHWGIEIIAAWQYRGDYHIRPFAWMQEYYDRRQKIVAEAKRTGIDNGEEKVIKLGINAGYGKLAQSVGSGGKPPPYANLAYAGYITSLTRARLFSAAATNPDAVVALATDGILTTGPLEIPVETDKILGAWSLEKLDAVLYAQSGFYWLKDDKGWSSFTRGFDRPNRANQNKMQGQVDQIRDAWRKGKSEVYFPSTRLVGLGSALQSDEWFKRWGNWHSMRSVSGQLGRKLSILDGSGKRQSGGAGQINPADGLRLTLPTHRSDEKMGEMSLQHTPEWLDQIQRRDSEIDQEHADSDE